MPWMQIEVTTYACPSHSTACWGSGPPEIHEAGTRTDEHAGHLGERRRCARERGSRTSIEAGAILLGPVVHDHPRFLHPGCLLRHLPRLVQVRDVVHQPE